MSNKLTMPICHLNSRLPWLRTYTVPIKWCKSVLIMKVWRVWRKSVTMRDYQIFNIWLECISNFRLVREPDTLQLNELANDFGLFFPVFFNYRYNFYYSEIKSIMSSSKFYGPKNQRKKVITNNYTGCQYMLTHFE